MHRMINPTWFMAICFVACAALPAFAADPGVSTEQRKAESYLKRLLHTRKARPSSEKVTYPAGGASAGAWREDEDLSANCQNDELQYLEVEQQILHAWEDAWTQKNSRGLLGSLRSGGTLPDFGGASRKFLRSDGVITEFKWDETALQKTALSDAKEQADSIERYLGQFSKIEDLRIVGREILADRLLRRPDMSIQGARVLARFDLRALDKSQNRREDRGNLEITVERTGAHEWKVTSVRGSGFDTLTASQTIFADATHESGVDKLPTYIRSEAIRRGGYALALADYDGDGNVDMLVGAKGGATLLKGDGKGHFTPVKDSGLEGLTLVKSAIFADFSNSGRQDLLILRFTPDAPNGKPLPHSWQHRNDVVLYRNQGNGKFKRDDAIHGDAQTGYPMPLAAADFNKDGYLDFYVGFPGNKDFTSLDQSGGYPASVKVQGLFMNDKGKGFTLEQDDHMLPQAFDKKSMRQKLYAHSALAVDFNQDGSPDIVVIDDRANLSPAYQNRGDGTFVQVAESIGVQNNAFGMGIAAVDYDNDGIIDMMMTNVGFTATRRMNNSCHMNWGKPLNEDAIKTADLRLFKGMGGGKFVDVAEAVGLDDYGEGLAGVEFIDFNNDGLPDIYVSNGLWSGTDRRQDLASEFMRARPTLLATRDLTEDHDKSQSNVMDILSFFQGDAFTGKRGSGRPSLAGFQRKRLFRNDGNGHFTEVGYLAGVDSIADGYVIAKSDLTRSGAQDLILRNADPGSADVNFPPVQVFHNLNPYKHKALAIRLEGVKSNRDAIGAEVTVTTKGRTQLQQLFSNNGTVQSEKILMFGLGDADSAERVRVKWPSGAVQTLKNVPAGTVKIRENDNPSGPLLGQADDE